MTYYFYFGNVLMPVTPSSLEFKIKNKNKTIELTNGGEANILKSLGLTDISFDLVIPVSKTPYALYDNGFKNANFYLDFFESLKMYCKSFDFKVIRSLSAMTVLQNSAKLNTLTGDQLAAADTNGDGIITAADARIILRNTQSGEIIYINDTTINVSLEEYTIKEDAEKYGQDFCVSVKLKKFEKNGTKQVTFR